MLPMSECCPEATLDRRRHGLGVEAPPSSLQLSNRFGKEDRVFVATSMAGSPRAGGRGQGLEYGAAQVNKIKAAALERIRSEDGSRGSSQGLARNSWSQVSSGG